MPIRATLILLFALLVGCRPPASARFEVDGVAPAHADCFDVAFPFVPIFHAYRERAGSVGLFFQSRGGNFQYVDVVYFEVFTPDGVPTGTPIPIDAEVTEDTMVAASIELGESCPPVGVLGTSSPGDPILEESPIIVGDVTFDQFSQEIDGVIAGTVDGRLTADDGEVYADSFTGEFEFTVQRGQPYEEFLN